MIIVIEATVIVIVSFTASKTILSCQKQKKFSLEKKKQYFYVVHNLKTYKNEKNFNIPYYHTVYYSTRCQYGI